MSTPFRVALLAVALLVLGPTATIASGMSMPPQPPAATLAGMVCSQMWGGSGHSDPYSCNGPGVPGATVRLTMEGTEQAPQATDDWGNFAFHGLKEGKAVLTVERQGFQPGSASVYVAGYTNHNVNLAGDKVRLWGQVRDEAGSGIADAQVHACCSDMPSPLVVGSDGRFDGIVPAGVYTLDVYADGYRGVHPEAVVDGTRAVNVTLHAMPPRDAVLEGTVTDQHGKPAAGLVVAAEPAWQDMGRECHAGQRFAPDCARPDPLPGNRTETDAAGRYRLALHAGPVSVRIESLDFAPYHADVDVPAGGAVHDLTVTRFAARDAHLAGRVTNGANGHAVASYTIEAHHPELGRNECSVRESAMTQKPVPEPRMVDPYGHGGYGPGGYGYGGHGYGGYGEQGGYGCRIRVFPDGTFDGFVTPGYTTIRVRAEQACTETRDADGTFRRDCGPEFLPFVETRALAGNATTEILIGLTPRPAADAIVSGYLVDSTTGKAVPGGQISFDNEGLPGSGYARTDADGSYRIRLRSGYHTVSVSVPGYFDWHGTVSVATGETPFDAHLTPGQSSGGCRDCGCYGGPCEPYPGGHPPMATPTAMPYPMEAGYCDGCAGPGIRTPVTRVDAPMEAPAPSPGDVALGGGAAGYQDLGGGLGRYDAEKRQAELNPEPKAAPGAGILLTSAIVLAAVALRRAPSRTR